MITPAKYMFKVMSLHGEDNKEWRSFNAHRLVIHNMVRVFDDPANHGDEAMEGLSLKYRLGELTTPSKKTDNGVPCALFVCKTLKGAKNLIRNGSQGNLVVRGLAINPRKVTSGDAGFPPDVIHWGSPTKGNDGYDTYLCDGFIPLNREK